MPTSAGSEGRAECGGQVGVNERIARLQQPDREGALPTRNARAAELTQRELHRERRNSQHGGPMHLTAHLGIELGVRDRFGAGEVDRAGDVGRQEVPDGPDYFVIMPISAPMS